MLNIETLKTEGIVIVENICSKTELTNLANSVGRIRPHPNGKDVVTLISTNGENSLPGTFSNTYGLSEFPFHTDTAFWGLPARYIVMGMISTSPCTTNYISLREINKLITGDIFNKARRAIYLVETFEGSKYTSPVFDIGESCGFKFDPNIMTPVNDYAIRFNIELLAALEKVEIKKIEWSGNKAVVFDNWNFLHSRSAVKNENREMFRIYLEN